MTVVSESGLYNLVLGSRKAEAKRFKRWVTHEVLPAIRKTGSYAVSAMAALPAPTQDRVTSLLLIGEADRVFCQSHQPAPRNPRISVP